MSDREGPVLQVQNWSLALEELLRTSAEPGWGTPGLSWLQFGQTVENTVAFWKRSSEACQLLPQVTILGSAAKVGGGLWEEPKSPLSNKSPGQVSFSHENVTAKQTQASA